MLVWAWTSHINVNLSMMCLICWCIKVNDLIYGVLPRPSVPSPVIYGVAHIY